MANSNKNVSPAMVFARPAPERAWLGPTQRDALTWLLESAPLRLLSGPRSSGKTVLLAHARARLTAAEAIVLHCRGPQSEAVGVLTSLLRDAELGFSPLGESDQRNLLAVFIEQRRLEGRRVVIMVDQAHDLGADAWDELDRLRRFRLDGSPAVELVLATAPAPIAGAGRLADWAEAAPAAMLTSASPEDAAAYLAWRFAHHPIANPFRPVATRLVAQLSGGRYGSIDALCQMAMILMRRREAACVDARLVQQAMDTLTALRAARHGRAAFAPPTDIGAAADALTRYGS